MEILKGIFKLLFDLIALISSILGIWSMIKSPEEVKGTLGLWFKYLRSLTTKQPKQTETVKATESPSEKLIGDAKRRSGKRSTGYIFILAAMIIIPIIIASIVSESRSAPETEIVAPQVDWSAAGGMNIVSLFWMCVCLFGFIGAMRGWAKEMLVVFSGMLALAINFLLVRYLPFLGDLPENNLSLFWVRLVIMVTLVYFGYQTVATIPALAAKSVSEKWTDVLIGMFTGGINGYLVAGTILAYVHRIRTSLPLPPTLFFQKWSQK
jgi:uncharacterized membrane protein required for colicin V production